MDSFTPLERTALNAIFAAAGERGPILERQLLSAKVASRENTGGGFFANLQVDPDAEPLDLKISSLGKNIWLGIEGLEYGLGAILHCKGGRANLLEGYAVGPEDTSPIDFVHVRFAIIPEPGPLPSYGN
ncbi:hypothetical protein [Rhizorhabdus sp.]|uniref:hypothetical protein n=1 Tax=Rhizorhabdus sp. TaxID=1968843 RepID=UPI00199B16EA|nr:hypothetical protein [Rhizorhabdus sp.]MBD3762237.1 hypothetical protein [Rhizorhabdus sp.]